MRKFVLVMMAAIFFFILPSAAFSQDEPKAEIFGGYSYMRFDVGDGGDALHMHGWNSSIAYNPSGIFGVVFDMSGQYARNCFDFSFTCSHHSFAAGPTFTKRGQTLSGFFHMLVGVDRAKLLIDDGVSTFSATDNSLLVGFGGGLDVRTSDLISFRPIQIDYMTTHHFNEIGADRQHNLRLSAGIVLTLGRR